MSKNGVSTTTTTTTGRVCSIPNSVMKTIENIKEIAENHSEDDIYTMLRDCSMDPNDTVQRLLYLDTFHQVKTKRGKRKESQVVKSKPGEDSRWAPGHHARGTRGGRGNASAHRASDAGGRRSNSSWKENGGVETRERGFRKPHAPVSKEINTDQPRHVEKALTIATNGPAKMPNGNLGGGQDSKPSGINTNFSKESTGPGSSSVSTIISNARTEDEPSAPDPMLMASKDSWAPPAGGAILPEERIEQKSIEVSGHILAGGGPNKAKSSSDSHPNQSDPQKGSTSMVEKEAYKPANFEQTNGFIELPSVEKSDAPIIMSAVKPIPLQDVSPLAGVEEAGLRLAKLKIFDGKNVIIPDHIQVPDAVKNVLSFGSINASFGAEANYVQNGILENSHSIKEESPAEASENSSSCDEDTVHPELQLEHTEFQNLKSHTPGEIHPVDTQVSSSANNDDQLKEHNLPTMGPPFPIVQTTPTYSFGFMPPPSANTIVHPEGFESQAHVSSSLGGGPPAVSTPSLAPPPQSSGVGQASIAMSPQQISLFRQPYPPNFFPYGPYYNPFYVPPNMHQYYGHSVFPQSVPANNVFVPPPTAAAATETSPAHYKSRANAGNQAPNGLPSGYGSYSSSQSGYSPNNMAISGNPSPSADVLLPTALKDNYPHFGQQSEGSTVWLPATGRDNSSFPQNSFINFPPQGHQLINPQSGHGPFAVYHTMQPIPSLAPGHPLLQQSQPVIGPVESVGPPSNAYQQSQRQHQHQPQPPPQLSINWNM